MPLLGNPTAAVLYPGKMVFAVLPYPWAARLYIVAHTLLAFAAMLALAAVLGDELDRLGAGGAGLRLRRADPVPVLQRHLPGRRGLAAPGFPRGRPLAAAGPALGLIELAVVLALQVLGGDPQSAYVLGLCAGGLCAGPGRSRETGPSCSPTGRSVASLAGGRVVMFVRLGRPRPCCWRLAPRLARPEPAGKPRPGPAVDDWMPLVWSRASGARRPGSARALAAAGAGSRPWARCWRAWSGRRRWRRRLVGGAAAARPRVHRPERPGGGTGAPRHLPLQPGADPAGRARLAQRLRDAFPGQTALARGCSPPMPATPKVWVPSLYLGGLTIVLAPVGPSDSAAAPLAGLAVGGRPGQPDGQPGRVHRPALVGPLRSPAVAALARPARPLHDATSIRLDGYLRDGDGSFYWLLATVLPGFRQFRFPSKLLTFTDARPGGAGRDGLGPT